MQRLHLALRCKGVRFDDVPYERAPEKLAGTQSSELRRERVRLGTVVADLDALGTRDCHVVLAGPPALLVQEFEQHLGGCYEGLAAARNLQRGGDGARLPDDARP